MNLMVRPFLLKNIDYLLNNNNSEELNYSLAIYKVLINKWIERDVNKIPNQDIKKKHEVNMFVMLQELAQISFLKGINENNYYLTNAEIAVLSKKHSIDFGFVKVRSLLNRDNYGNIKFAHKSVLEYFIAIKALTDKELRLLISKNPSYDVANLFLDEYYFYNEIIKIIKNCDGHYFITNGSKAIPLSALSINSMYNATSIYLNKFDLSHPINSLIKFKKLKEVIFLISVDGIKLSDIYYVVYCHWFECLHILNKLFTGLYIPGRYFDRHWFDLYINLYKINTKYEIDYFRSKKLIHYRYVEKIKYEYLRYKYEQLPIKGNHPGFFSEFEHGTPIEQFIIKLHYGNFTNIIKQISTITSSKVRTIVEYRRSILTYSLQAQTDALCVDEALQYLNSKSSNSYQNLDNYLDNFNKDLHNQENQEGSINIYY